MASLRRRPISVNEDTSGDSDELVDLPGPSVGENEDLESTKTIRHSQQPVSILKQSTHLNQQVGPSPDQCATSRVRTDNSVRVIEANHSRKPSQTARQHQEQQKASMRSSGHISLNKKASCMSTSRQKKRKTKLPQHSAMDLQSLNLDSGRDTQFMGSSSNTLLSNADYGFAKQLAHTINSEQQMQVPFYSTLNAYQHSQVSQETLARIAKQRLIEKSMTSSRPQTGRRTQPSTRLASASYGTNSASKIVAREQALDFRSSLNGTDKSQQFMRQLQHMNEVQGSLIRDKNDWTHNTTQISLIGLQPDLQRRDEENALQAHRDAVGLRKSLNQ